MTILFRRCMRIRGDRRRRRDDRQRTPVRKDVRQRNPFEGQEDHRHRRPFEVKVATEGTTDESIPTPRRRALTRPRVWSDAIEEKAATAFAAGSKGWPAPHERPKTPFQRPMRVRMDGHRRRDDLRRKPWRRRTKCREEILSHVPTGGRRQRVPRDGPCLRDDRQRKP
jgi:hypothetical protein